MTEIHAFDPDGTPSPGAQAALGEAIDAIPDATAESRGMMSNVDKQRLDGTLSASEAVLRDSSKLIAGAGAAPALDDYDIGADGTVVAIGAEAMAEMSEVKKSIAIGRRALGAGDKSRDNIAIGEDALYMTSSLSSDYTQTGTDGTRNVAIGGNAGRHIAHGVGHVAVGRNAGQNVVGGTGLVAIGNGAHASHCPIGLSGEVENWASAGGDATAALNVTAVGQWAAGRNRNADVTALGANASRFSVNSGETVAVGSNALRRVDETAWLDGHAYAEKNLTGTYVHSGSLLTVAIPEHGATVGDVAVLRLTSGASQTFGTDPAPAVVTSVTAGSFTVAHPLPGNASGDAILLGLVDVNSTPADSNYATAVGAAALAFLNGGRSNTGVGYQAGGALAKGQNNTFVGSQAGKGAVGAEHSDTSAFGYQALKAVSTGTGNTGVGMRALYAVTTGSNNTALGSNAGRFMQSGNGMTNVDNSTAIGRDARVSGSNQVQLGDSATTTYVYGTVQNRSDARDKADVRDTELGLAFIEKLRPVDFRWDMREDYEDRSPDGTRKRARFHHGVIAQEVQALDAGFGGVQDHSLNGGDDVLTVGYDEFVAPLIKAVQELSARVRELEDRLSA